jgi:hypothetical protein
MGCQKTRIRVGLPHRGEMCSGRIADGAERQSHAAGEKLHVPVRSRA